MSATESKVRPNARYDAVFGTSYADASESEREEAATETEDEQDAYADIQESARDYDAPDTDDTDVLEWNMVSVTTDPDLLNELTRYFEGVTTEDDVDDQREKLASGDVEWYVNVQMVVKRSVGLVEYGPDDEDLNCDACGSQIEGWESEFERVGFARAGGQEWRQDHVHDDEEVVCGECISDRIIASTEA